MDSKGIERDLSNTPFNIVVSKYIFYFSSRANMERFSDEMDAAFTYYTELIYKKYKIEAHLNMYSLIRWYMKVERRGFRIDLINTEEVITCPQEVKIIGETITKNNLEL